MAKATDCETRFLAYLEKECERHEIDLFNLYRHPELVESGQILPIITCPVPVRPLVYTVSFLLNRLLNESTWHENMWITHAKQFIPPNLQRIANYHVERLYGWEKIQEQHLPYPRPRRSILCDGTDRFSAICGDILCCNNYSSPTRFPVE